MRLSPWKWVWKSVVGDVSPSHLPGPSLNPRTEKKPSSSRPAPHSLAKLRIRFLMENLSSWGVKIGKPPQEAFPAFTEGSSLISQQHGFQLDLRKNFLTGLRDWQEFKKRQTFYMGG